MKSPRSSALRRLADRVLEVPDLEGLSRLLTQALPDLLGVDAVSFLLWNRSLDAFEGLTDGKTQLQPFRLGDDTQPITPEARYLLSEGALLDTPGAKGDGTLIPLMARSGLVGMLVLGPRRHHAQPPFDAHEIQQLSRLAGRVALATENHLYQRELIASERMTALGTMASMLAHDFRGPMTVIRGYAETFLDASTSLAEIRSRAETILQMVDRLDRMATETLDFARGGGRLVRRAVDLAQALGQIADAVETEFPDLEVVRRFLVPRGTTASLDLDKLERAVDNVAANARDAMGGRGRFYMSARVDTSEGVLGGPIPRLVLVLADDGPGVPEAIEGRVFEPFVTHGKKRGTGLGLVVSRRFVEDHGGSIELLSRRDDNSPDSPSGARFKIVLPLSGTGASRVVEEH